MVDQDEPAQAFEAPELPIAPPQVLSLGMVANTVESFSGRERVEEYFEKIELRSRLDQWDQKTTLDIIRYRLTGEAYRYLKTDPELESPTIAYSDFKEKFIARFSPIRIPGENLIKLSRCFQKHDETVANFVSRLKVLGAEILKEDLLHASAHEISGLTKKCNELVLHQFKAGIKREYLKNLGPLLMRTENLTIDKAEEFARQEELNTLMLNNRQASGSILAIKCYTCGRPGHYASDCRQRMVPNNPGRYFNNHSQNNNHSRFANFSSGNIRNGPRRDFEFNDNQQPRSNYAQNLSNNRPNNFYRGRFNDNHNSTNSRQNYNRQNSYRPAFPNSQQNSYPREKHQAPVQTLNSNAPSFAPRTGGN